MAMAACAANCKGKMIGILTEALGLYMLTQPEDAAYNVGIRKRWARSVDSWRHYMCSNRLIIHTFLIWTLSGPSNRPVSQYEILGLSYMV